MRVFYVITKIVTFPAAILRAYFEQVFCRIFRIPVEDNRYLRTDEMCGHVEHELISKKAPSYFLCFFPGLISFVLGVLLSLPVIINLFYLGKYSFGFSFAAADLQSTGMTLLLYVCLWLCFSIFTNLFPSIEDTLWMKEKVYGEDGMSPFAKIVFFPGFAVMYIGSRLEARGLTFIINLALILALIII